MKRALLSFLVIFSFLYMSCSFFDNYQLKTRHTIYYDANGGTGTMDSQTVAEGNTATLEANTFTREEYGFAGWATSTEAASAEYADGTTYTMGDSDVTLYAVWGKEYTITYNANGGSGTMEDQTAVSGSTVTLETNTYTYDGYVFEGWSTSDSATSASYTDGTTYTMGDSDVTLYAVWSEAPTHTITYNANGGSGTMESQTVAEGVTVTLNTNTFTSDDYDFAGWAETNTASSVEYADKASFTMGTEDVILYAVWVTPVAVTGVEISDSSVAIAYDETYQLSLTFSPENATNTNATWTSSDESIATVDDTGLVTGIAVGTATITAETEDGYYVATCSVTVDEFPFKKWEAAGSHSWNSIAISEDGDFIAATCGDDYIENSAGDYIEDSGGLYTSSDHGESWSLQSDTEDLGLTNLSMSADGALMAAYVENDYIYTSTDKGESWTRRTGASSREWTDIDVSNDGTFIAACPNGGYIFTSEDGGDTWTAQTESGAEEWECIAVSEDGSVIVAGVYSDYLSKSTDKGNTWEKLSGTDTNTNGCVISDDGLIIYASYGSGRSYISTDGGENWESFDAYGYPAASYDGNIAFIFSTDSKYCTWDTGTTWETLDRSTGSPGALSGNGQLAVYASDNYLYFWDCSESTGYLSGSVSDLSDIDLAIIGSTSVTCGESATFTARADDSFTVVGWYLDNTLLEDETDTSYSTDKNLAAGSHTLTVQVKANGLLYSASFRFKVSKSE